MDVLAVISALCGWVYTFCWSLSFYPQALLNARRRSTAGTTVDFPLINCLGFLSYLLSNAALRYSSVVRAEYAARHHGLTPTVATNDVVFPAHALALSLVTVSQYLLPGLWGWTAHNEPGGLLAEDGDGAAPRRRRALVRASHRSGNRPSRFILGLASGCVTAVGITVLLVLKDGGGGANAAGPIRGAQAMRASMAAAAAAKSPFSASQEAVPGSASSVAATPTQSEAAALLAAWMATGAWTWLDVVYALGYVKLVITLVKYAPQLLANWRNRSTAGWSIAQILLDFVGGLLSIAQLLLDSYRQHDWSGLTGNPVKLALGNVSMVYDLVFFTQHYVLYKGGSARSKGYGGEEDGDSDGGGDAHGAINSERPRVRETERDALLASGACRGD